MDEIVGDSSDSDVVGDAPVRPRAPRAIQRQGPLRIFLLVAGTAGMWGSWKAPGVCLADDIPAAPEGQAIVLGAALAFAWSFAGADKTPLDAIHEAMRRRSQQGSKAGRLFGFIDYPVVCAAEFHEPAYIPWPASLACLAALAALQVWTRVPHGDERRSGYFGSVLDEWRKRCSTAPVFAIFGTGLARSLARGLCACLHTVPVTRRLARKRLLVQREPSKRRLHQFTSARSTVPSRMAPRTAAVRPLPKWAPLMRDPHLVLDWLEATQFVKVVRKVGALVVPFSKILARNNPSASEAPFGQVEMVGYSTLRMARMRLDCVAMLVWRRVWGQTVASAGDQVNLYLFSDASPTWRGVELWASSFDLYDGSSFTRRLFPCVALNTQLVDARGKTLALLWQIFLLAGPSFEMVRRFCGRVRAIVTDMGVERKICDMPDMVCDLFNLLCPGYTTPADPIEFLWPRAVQMPGWKHQVDLLIRQGLNSMSFFPLWLKRLKAVNSFLRQDTYAQRLAGNLRQRGLVALAESILAAKLPTFAEWRWGTLHVCLSSLMTFLDSLIAHFDPAPFAHAREGANLTTVLEALRSRDWRRQSDFTLWFTGWLTKLMEWGTGCSCHEAELLAGRDVVCARKGRRLQEAGDHVRSEFAWALQEANAWTEHTWGCGVDFLVAAQGCVRAVTVAGQQKFDFLDKLPYLLVQLPLPGGRRKVLDQWAAASPEAHHRVTREFLLEGSPLRKHIDEMAPDGTGIHPQLAAEIESLLAIPMDDSVAEGPHARAKREQTHARSSRFPWVASSMRLAQNIEDCRVMPNAIGEDLLPLWCGWKSLTRLSGSASLQNKRMQTGAFLDTVYRMSFDTAAGSGSRDMHPEGNDTDEDLGELVAPSDVAGPRRGAVGERKVAHGWVGGASESALSDPLVAPAEALPQREPEEVALMRQWLSASLERYSYISAPVSGDDGHFSHMFFQVLSMEQRQLRVQTFKTVEEQEAGAGLYTISAQPLSRWRSPVTNPEDGPGTEAECYVYSDPVTVDILGICGGGASNRRHWHVWKHAASDLAGCIALRSPETLAPKMRLSHLGIPVLALQDELLSQGFEPVRGATTHEQDAPKFFDTRRLASKRAYLQCVLALPDLLTAGVQSFSSGHSVVYYKVLLKTKKPVDPALSAKELRLLLARAEGDEVTLAALTAGPSLPAARSAKRAAPEPLEDADSGSSIVGDDEPEPLTTIAAAPAELVPQDGEGDASEIVGDAPAGSADAAGVPPPAAPDTILGQAVAFVRGRADRRWSYNDRLSVNCRNPEHSRCSKSRSLSLEQEALGPRAAEGFLGAWLMKSDMPAAEHSRYKPTRAEVREYLESH